MTGDDWWWLLGLVSLLVGLVFALALCKAMADE